MNDLTIEPGEGALRVRLPADCTIAETETHLATLKDALAARPPEIELTTGDVAVLDTAYLQLILSLKAEAAGRSIPFSVPDPSPEVRRLCELYGIHL